MRVRVCIENGKKRECVLVSLRERVRERESERKGVCYDHKRKYDEEK